MTEESYLLVRNLFGALGQLLKFIRAPLVLAVDCQNEIIKILKPAKKKPQK